MTNILARVRYPIDVPEEKVFELAGPDDGSEFWYERACGKVEEAIQDDPLPFLEKYSSEPEVEVD